MTLLRENVTMSEMQQATVMATNTIFDRLGAEVSEILKSYLGQYYSIYLEPDCLFAVEEIGIALQRLVGEAEARSIMQEIRQEMADLKSMQERLTKQRKGNLTFWCAL
jgi:L-rhamnose mutarotase